MTLQHLRSSTANKRPTPAAMSDGQLAMNTNLASPGLFLKDSNGDLVKIGPVHVGTTAPNATPAVGGQAGNSKGEQWLDTTGGVYVFKIYDGTAWRSETGTFVDVNGDTMTGALGIIAGSAAAPSLFFSGDTNTGIYSPGADQVAVATNGTGRLFVDATGNVGVGTSGPSTYVQDNGLAVYRNANNSQPNFNVINASTLGSAASVLQVLSGGGGGGSCLITATSSGWGDYGILKNASTVIESQTNWLSFGAPSGFIFGTGASPYAEKLRITSAGLVGIGTSSPGNTAGFGQQLQLTGNLPCITIDNTGTGANKYSLGVNGSGAFGVWDNTASAFRMYINSSGSVGIGSTSPQGLCDVAGSNGRLVLANGNTSGGMKITATNAAYSANGYLAFEGYSTEYGRFDTSGRLLVGTSTSVSAGAWVNGATTQAAFGHQVAGVNWNEGSVGLFSYETAANAAPQISFNKSNSNTLGTFGTALGASTDIGSIVFSGSDGTKFVPGALIAAEVDGTSGANDMPGRLVFSTTADGASATTERMRITSAGLVGIGTSSPGAQLQVTAPSAGRSYSSSVLDFSNIHLDGITAGTTTSALTFSSGSGGGAAIAFSRGGSFQTEMSFWTCSTNVANSATQRMVIDSAGSVGIGTTSPNALLDVRSATAWVGDGTTDAFLQFNQSATAANRWHIGAGSSNALSFYKGTYGTGVETARIDSSGRLLVGTSTAGTAKVSIQGATGNSTYTVEGLSVAVGGDTVNPNGRGVVAEFGAGGVADGAATYGATINLGASSVGQFGIRIVPGSAFAISDYYPGGAYVGAANPPTERMRINTVGNLLVGRTGTDGAALIQAPASSTVPSYGSATGVSTAITHFEFRNSNGLVGTISTNASATAYNTSSDYRLKENVIPVSDGIVRLQQLKPSRFNFIADSDQTVDGFIAHEVQAVVPECVTGEKDAVDEDGNPVYQGIDQSKLVPLLTAALQEAIAKIETLEARLTTAGIE